MGAFSWFALSSECQLLELPLLELDNKITPCSYSYSVHLIKSVNLRRLQLIFLIFLWGGMLLDS